jgi:hypothetical protein
MSDERPILDKPRSLTPESFKAVAKAVEDITGSTSLPPAVKAENERHKMDLSARTDWFMGFLVFLLILLGRIPVEPYFWAMVALGSPSAVASMLHLLGLRRSAGASMTALLATGVGKAGLAGVLKGSGLLGLALLIGCASFYSETNEAINTTAVKINQAQPAVLLLCQADPGERCDDARKAYEAAGAAVEAAHAANEVVRLTGAGVDEVGKALRKLYDAAAEVANVATQ